MTTLKVGIASYDEMKARTMAVARGERRVKADEPKVWFTSTESFAKVLSATMTFSPPAVRFFANWEPMFPRPMIAVFMIIRFLVYGSLKSARVAAWGCHPMFCRDRS